MRLGIYAPQGWLGEFSGFEPADAWARTVEIVGLAERAGVDSVWAADHFHVLVPSPTEALTFAALGTLLGIAPLTQRVQLGPLVVCAGFRNPALLVKEYQTLDAVSGGRAALGVGSGWAVEEWEAYGYGPFPPFSERVAALEDQLEIATRLLRGGRGTYAGAGASVAGAYVWPDVVKRPVPIVVGGNGPEKTWRLAAQFADELNLSHLDPDAVAAALPVIRQRCEEIDRDPDTLAVSIWLAAGDERDAVDRFKRYAELGLRRVMIYRAEWTADPTTFGRLIEQARAAGIELID